MCCSAQFQVIISHVLYLTDTKASVTQNLRYAAQCRSTLYRNITLTEVASLLDPLFIILTGYAAQREQWPTRSRGLLITHNDAPQSVGLIWTSDQLVVETST
jgi:hypothetical protein